MKQTIQFNLNVDDIHPETSEYLADCGGDKEKGVFSYFFQLIKEFPEIKITLFVTPNWTNKSKSGFIARNMKRLVGHPPGKQWSGEPFHLTKHKEWCAWLNKQENFELALHGYTHYAPTTSYAQEFRGLSYEEARQRLTLAEQTCNDAGLKVVKGFRPPGWGFSEGMFQALRELKYDYIAIDGPSAGIKEIHPTQRSVYKGLVNVPQNWDAATGTVEEAQRLINQGVTFLSAKAHIARQYGNDCMVNGMCEETYQNVRTLLQLLTQEYTVKFVTMMNIVRRE